MYEYRQFLLEGQHASHVSQVITELRKWQTRVVLSPPYLSFISLPLRSKVDEHVSALHAPLRLQSMALYPLKSQDGPSTPLRTVFSLSDFLRLGAEA